MIRPLAGIAGLLLIGASWSAGVAMAAQTTPPPYTHSWYVTTDDTMTNYNRGVSDGAYDNSHCTNAMAIVDFGQIDYNATQDTYVVLVRGINQWKTTAQVTDAVKNYAFGWYHATGGCTSLKLVIGTNNFAMCPNWNNQGLGRCDVYWAGRNWAKVATDLQNYLVAQGYSWQITAMGGGDWETDWDCASKTRRFVDGFSSNNGLSLHLENYGDANNTTGCWSAADVVYVSYGAPPAYALPQIYNQYRTDTWRALRQSYTIAYDGVLTECNSNGDPLPAGNCAVVEGTTTRSEFSPTAAWNSLWNAMNAYGIGQSSLNYASNIRYMP